MLDEGFKRKLTDTFSQLYTGNVIHSAEFGHWDNLGGGQAYHPPKTLLQKAKEAATLADPIFSKSTKSVHE